METTVDLAALVAGDPAISERNRTITMRWPLGPGTNHLDEPVDLYLALSVGHDKDRKVYFSSVRREEQNSGIVSFSLMDFVSVDRTPVARYGLHTHQAAAATALTALRTMTDDPRLAELAATGRVTRR